MAGLFEGRYVKLNPVAMHELLEGSRGPVMRDAFEHGVRIRDLAATKIRPSRIRGGPTKGGSTSMRSNAVGLRDAGVVVFARAAGETLVVVSFRKPYATYVHEGTRPHIIMPKKAGGVLAFYWPKAGKTVFMRQVHHPGTQGQHYLTDAAEAEFGFHITAVSSAGVFSYGGYEAFAGSG